MDSQIKNFGVSNFGEVSIVDYMGSDLSVVNAAKVSYGNQSKEIGEKEIKLINYLAAHQHTSPFRHQFVSFRIKAPEFIMRQWYKHTIGCVYSPMDAMSHGWNEISGRYTSQNITPDNFYIPGSIRMPDPNNKQASIPYEGREFSQGELILAIAEHNYDCITLYNSLLNAGVAKEMARIVLPLTMKTEVIWTASLQAIAHFINLRNKSHTQYEIQWFANTLEQLVTPLFPHSLPALLANL